jgi:hypothetical protein
MEDIQATGYGRMLIESDVITKNGLQFFLVDKADHLIPEGVLKDKDLKFRARRMYMTGSDLNLMASDNVNLYDKSAVDAVLATRMEWKQSSALAQDGNNLEASERVRAYNENYDLAFQWQEQDESLKAMEGSQPYQDVFAVYRITCKYAYATKNDPKGLIPKWIQVDYSPEGKQILRAVVYPHLHDRMPWFHFKLGFAPKHYYGLGFGARLMQDDFLESNAVDLTMDAAALATFNPFLCKHPEAGGRIPFSAGYGPGKIGYVNDVNDFHQLTSPPVNTQLIQLILPLTATRSANRTSVTSLTQGQPDSNDPRSPAQKTAMLIGQASVGMDIMVADWNRTGWEPLADFVWRTMYEQAAFVKSISGDLKSVCGGLIVDDGQPLTKSDENKVTISELSKALVWSSLASTDYLSPQLRQQKFLQMMNIFMPMLQGLAQFNPMVFRTYFMRWINRAAQEFDLQGMSYLIPTEAEMAMVPDQALPGMLDQLSGNMRANMSQNGLMTSGGEGGQKPAAPANTTKGR